MFVSRKFNHLGANLLSCQRIRPIGVVLRLGSGHSNSRYRGSRPGHLAVLCAQIFQRDHGDIVKLRLLIHIVF
jgi:hypothetical protein